jgi:L-amino acid N-acyltransferase YncA
MINIRDAIIDDCEEIGLVTVSASHSVFIGAIPEELIDFSWTPEISAANWRKSFSENTDRGQSFIVAEEDHRILGFLWAKPWAETTGFEACIQGLYILPTFQRRGIGRQLISYVVAALMQLNMKKLEIGCVVENPSCDFYRHIGGVEIGRRPVKVDHYDTEEIVFGWSDISVLRG